MSIQSEMAGTVAGLTFEGVLADTQRAFDGVARTYAQSNEENRILSAMRARSVATAMRYAPSGAWILDLGCGPGTDAEAFAREGRRVTAIDWSPTMADEARRRIGAGQLEGRVDVHHLGIHEIDRLPAVAFDLVYSSFGPINCVANLPQAAELIARRLRPGGSLVASVIGRVCPWEIALHGLRRDWTRLRVRFGRGLMPVPLDGRTVWTQYYSPRRFARAFVDAGFAGVSLRALGLFVPPPYMQAFAGRHPVLIDRLQRLEDAIGDWPGVRGWGDHFLIVMRKV